jgi:DNA-binding NarL/FixJ family response regulator
MRGFPPEVKPLRVVVMGDAALIEALASDTDRLVLSSVETNLEVSARVSQADVLVVDVAVQSEKGLLAIRTLEYDRPVLALVAAGQESEALAAGAAGAIRRTRAPKAIAAAVVALAHGLAVVEPKVLADQPMQLHVTAKPATVDHVLTPRESEVLTLLAEGLSNKGIAARLGISEHTAKFHVNSILQKMGAQKRVDAVVRAARRGLITIA